jgi:predicted PurR-regulated permease PerM
MFALYYIVLLSGMSNYPAFVRYVGGKRQETFLKNYETIQKSILAYILTKTLINLSTGALVTIICLIFGIKFALFWGLLVFLLNFVPQIGSVLGILPIVMMGLIQFDSIQAILLLIILTEAVLFTMGNVLEPKVMGSRLRLNTITVLFGLVFWGYLWGIAGMMLSIPLMVIIKLTFDNIPSFHVFGRVMGYPEKK